MPAQHCVVSIPEVGWLAFKMSPTFTSKVCAGHPRRNNHQHQHKPDLVLLTNLSTNRPTDKLTGWPTSTCSLKEKAWMMATAGVVGHAPSLCHSKTNIKLAACNVRFSPVEDFVHTWMVTYLCLSESNDLRPLTKQCYKSWRGFSSLAQTLFPRNTCPSLLHLSLTDELANQPKCCSFWKANGRNWHHWCLSAKASSAQYFRIIL